MEVLQIKCNFICITYDICTDWWKKQLNFFIFYFWQLASTTNFDVITMLLVSMIKLFSVGLRELLTNQHILLAPGLRMLNTWDFFCGGTPLVVANILLDL